MNVEKVLAVAQTLVNTEELTLERSPINAMSVEKPSLNTHILLDIIGSILE